MAVGISPEQAAHSALAAFRGRHGEAAARLAAGPPAKVTRLDRPGAYWLVPLHDSAGLRGIVQLDAERGETESVAAIRDPASAFLLDAGRALAAAQRAHPGWRQWRAPYLGWRPCRESFDSKRPLWVIPHADGEVFVSQSGEVFEQLTSGRGGG